ncbi:MAG: polysaccharide deacetylase family protein [Clostridia bacterium]|nr:polysaccharide deacetylase family protein [Clostridia bacterium]
MLTKYMTIVFDDGPLPFMCEIVDLFNEYSFKAGFAVMGARINDDTEYMLKYAIDNGFQLVGHSHSHPKLETVSREQVIKEMTKPISYVKNRIGYDMKNWARLPHLCRDESVLQICKELKLILLGHGMRCGSDWLVDATPENIIHETLDTACDGAIACMHVKEHTYQALKTILPELKKRGFELVNPDELFKIKGKTDIPIGIHIHNINEI